jgi:hypothetical protein
MDWRRSKRKRAHTVMPKKPDNTARIIDAIMLELADYVSYVDTDIPWPSKDAWPVGVAAAAAHIQFVSNGSRESEEYVFGVRLEVADTSLWQKCILLAPWVYCFSAYEANFSSRIELADEGQSIVVYLWPEERESMDTAFKSQGFTERLVLIPRRSWRNFFGVEKLDDEQRE